MSVKKRYKQAAILPEIELRINLMPEAEQYGFAYAANFALAQFFQLPAPELPVTRSSNAAKNVKSAVRAAAGKRGAAAKWSKE